MDYKICSDNRVLLVNGVLSFFKNKEFWLDILYSNVGLVSGRGFLSLELNLWKFSSGICRNSCEIFLSFVVIFGSRFLVDCCLFFFNG